MNIELRIHDDSLKIFHIIRAFFVANWLIFVRIYVMDFLRQHQLDIMLILSSICAILTLFVFLTGTLPVKRRRALMLMELSAMFLLIFDRYAYIYRGNPSTFAWWMVRISNFIVYFLSVFILHTFTLYLIDLYTVDGKLQRIPKRLKTAKVLSFLGELLIIAAQFTNTFYTFDDFNRYVRAPGFGLCYLFPFFIMILQFSVIIQYYNRISKSIRISILLFTTLPVAATFTQIFTYGLSLTNITLTAEVIMLYVFVLLDMNKRIEVANKREIQLLKEEQKNIHVLFEQTAEALASAIDAKDKYTHGHSTRVADYSKKIANLAGKSPKECEEVYFAALLHDVGKIGISDSLINKAGKLSDEEFAIIKKHPTIGKQILSSISKSPYLSLGANYHHERYDGKGYPDNLKGDDIPAIARIIAVADAYDAMTSKRSYRDPLPQQKVREEIVKGTGTQFDPTFAKIMINLIDMDIEYSMKEYEEIKEFGGRNMLQCGEFRSAVSEGIHITRNRTKIRLHCKADDVKASLRSIPSFILFDSLNGRILETPERTVEMNYFEYAVIRFDGLSESSGARKIQTDLVQNADLDEIDWTEIYKSGIDYEIEASRVDDHILISITNKYQTAKVTVALPDCTRFSYLAITGEYCSITNLQIENTELPVSDDYIARIAKKISYIEGAPEGDIPNIQIDGWRTGTSQAVPVSEGLKITFHTRSLPTSRLIWHCPFLSLFYSSNRTPEGSDYREFVLIRLDGENWESDAHAENSIIINKNQNFAGWDAWKEANRNGMDCEIIIRRHENTITVTTENMGISIRSVTTINDSVPEVFAALTGDQCALTNIRVTKLR